MLLGVLVKLRLALRELVLRELLHQAQNGAEGASRLSPDLRQSPQPGNVDVRVPDADDVHVHRLASGQDALFQCPQSCWDALVERFRAYRVARVQRHECRFQRVVKLSLDRIVVAKLRDDFQRHARGGDKIARRLVDLDDGALAHEQLGQLAAAIGAPRPAVQRQAVSLSIAPGGGQHDFLVVAVGGGIRLSVDVRQRFRVAEVVRLAQRQVERDWRIPPGRNFELAAHDEVGCPGSPVRMRRDDLPPAVVNICPDGRRFLRAGQRLVVEGGDRLVLLINQRFNQFEALRDFCRCPANFV